MPAASKKLQFAIDCTVPVKDNIIKIEDFEKYLTEHIKVNGKTNNLGDAIAVSRSDAKINVVATNALSKRYLKYLTKKYLKKQTIRDYLRVVADGKESYKLVYFQTAEEDQE